jgi:hypothetical protein
MRTAARLSRAVAVSLDLRFDGSRLVLRGGKFSLGDFGTKFLPFPKLIGDVLWRFPFWIGRRRGDFILPSRNEKPPSRVRSLDGFALSLGRGGNVLAQNDNSYMTGQTVAMSGGMAFN